MRLGHHRPRSETLTDRRLEALYFIYLVEERHSRGAFLNQPQATAICWLEGDYFRRSKHTNRGRRYWLTEKGIATVEWLLACEALREDVA